MKPFTISLWFDRNAEDAAKFYTSIFKDGKMGRIARYGKEGFEHHQQPEGSVMSIEFTANGQNFIGINGGPLFQFSEAFSLMVYCQTQAEIDNYWDKLTADGGKGIQCGWLKDKFGFSWQVTPTLMDEVQYQPDSPAKARLMNEMFKQVKFDIAKLQQAYEGK